MGSSISTIKLGSSEHGSLNYIDAIKVSMSGSMYEKQALNLPDEKKRIHDETITHRKTQQQTINNRMQSNQPSTITNESTKLITTQPVVQPIHHHPHITILNSTAVDLIQVGLSAHITILSIKKPLQEKKPIKKKKERRKHANDKNTDLNILIFWDVIKGLNQ